MLLCRRGIVGQTTSTLALLVILRRRKCKHIRALQPCMSVMLGCRGGFKGRHKQSAKRISKTPACSRHCRAIDGIGPISASAVVARPDNSPTDSLTCLRGIDLLGFPVPTLLLEATAHARPTYNVAHVKGQRITFSFHLGSRLCATRDWREVLEGVPAFAAGFPYATAGMKPRACGSAARPTPNYGLYAAGKSDR